MGLEVEERQVTPWRKSSYTGNGGNTCIEVSAWTKSSYSNNGGDTCVEVGHCSHAVAVRDSKDPDGPRLSFSPQAWSVFLDSYR